MSAPSNQKETERLARIDEIKQIEAARKEKGLNPFQQLERQKEEERRKRMEQLQRNRQSEPSVVAEPSVHANEEAEARRKDLEEMKRKEHEDALKRRKMEEENIARREAEEERLRQDAIRAAETDFECIKQDRENELEKIKQNRAGPNPFRELEKKQEEERKKARFAPSQRQNMGHVNPNKQSSSIVEVKRVTANPFAEAERKRQEERAARLRRLSGLGKSHIIGQQSLLTEKKEEERLEMPKDAPKIERELELHYQQQLSNLEEDETTAQQRKEDLEKMAEFEREKAAAIALAQSQEEAEAQAWIQARAKAQQEREKAQAQLNREIAEAAAREAAAREADDTETESELESELESEVESEVESEIDPVEEKKPKIDSTPAPAPESPPSQPPAVVQEEEPVQQRPRKPSVSEKPVPEEISTTTTTTTTTTAVPSIHVEASSDSVAHSEEKTTPVKKKHKKLSQSAIHIDEAEWEFDIELYTQAANIIEEQEQALLEQSTLFQDQQRLLAEQMAIIEQLEIQLAQYRQLYESESEPLDEE